MAENGTRFTFKHHNTFMTAVLSLAQVNYEDIFFFFLRLFAHSREPTFSACTFFFSKNSFLRTQASYFFRIKKSLSLVSVKLRTVLWNKAIFPKMQRTQEQLSLFFFENNEHLSLRKNVLGSHIAKKLNIKINLSCCSSN